jgi:N-acetylglucosaminyl-diphospho-decaprenol L-rhamnosyltransferase
VSPTATSPRVRVVVLNYNGGDLLVRCIDSLRRTAWPDDALDLVVVDNASTDTSVQRATEGSAVRVIRTPVNEGFPANNHALRDLRGIDYVALVNNDVTVEPGWLAPLVEALEADTGLAAANALITFADRIPPTVNNAGNEVLVSGYGRDRGLGSTNMDEYATPAEVFAWCGAAVLLRPTYLADVGVFDERFFLYYEDTDLSWRGQLRGWRYACVPSSRVSHVHSASVGEGSDLHRYYSERNRLIMLVKNAPAGMAARAVLRFPLSTASYVRDRRMHVARLRLRSYIAFLGLLPHALRARRRIRRRATVDDGTIIARLIPDEG